MRQHAEDEAMDEMARQRTKAIVRMNQDFLKIGMVLGGKLAQFIARREGKGLSPSEVLTVWRMVRTHLGLPISYTVEQQEKDDEGELTDEVLAQMNADVQRGTQHRAAVRRGKR